MKRSILLAATGLLGLAFIHQSGRAQHAPTPYPPPACEPGYKIIAETCYREEVRTFCKRVPEKKKKWVYSCEQESFCIPQLSRRHGHGCDPDPCGCDTCSHRTRNLLIKRQVDVECPGTKCVIEKIVEKVPYTVYRKVPCTPPTAAPRKAESIPAPAADPDGKK